MWFSAAVLCVVHLVALFAPGAFVAVAAGQRGWVVACAAPVVTYGLIGSTGPLVPLLGLRWSPVTLVVVTFLVAGLVFAVRRLVRRGPQEPEVPFWYRSRHLLFAGAIMVAAAVGLVAMYTASKAFTAIPQWWDAGVPRGRRAIHRRHRQLLAKWRSRRSPLLPRRAYFYPNGFHVLAATVYSARPLVRCRRCSTPATRARSDVFSTVDWRAWSGRGHGAARTGDHHRACWPARSPASPTTYSCGDRCSRSPPPSPLLPGRARAVRADGGRADRGHGHRRDRTGCRRPDRRASERHDRGRPLRRRVSRPTLAHGPPGAR